MLKRLPDWPSLLNSFIISRFDTPFAWGSHDCVLFACDAILAMTGTDPAKDFRGFYETEIGAARILRKVILADSLSEATHRLCLAHGVSKLPSVLNAQRGDLLLLRQTERDSLGIVSLNGRTAVAPGLLGITECHLEYALAAWRI